jgi:3-phenylpropionate/trans-cinnamate dioxygenase ferredoxin subunit
MSFQRACALADLTEGTPLSVELDGLDVAIVREGDDVLAIEDECSHAAVALSEGEVAECQIECYLHGSRFDLRTGKPTGLPATEPVATFPVEIRDGDIYVDTTTTLNGVSPS